MKEKFTMQPDDATHYMEAHGVWAGTWFKKDESGKWVGRTDSMDYWCENCGYEEDLIKPIPVNYMHKAAPKMYAMLNELKLSMYGSGMRVAGRRIEKLLAEARGEI